jgi:hypothetical protein
MARNASDTLCMGGGKDTLLSHRIASTQKRGKILLPGHRASNPSQGASFTVNATALGWPAADRTSDLFGRILIHMGRSG